MTDPAATGTASEDPPLRDAERMKFFTDAVVAIAMTLLILPLLESVADVKGENLTTAEFFSDHGAQVISFVISFVVVAVFWISHERSYGWVGYWTGPLMMLNIAWMMTIVFLPIAAALGGSMETDPLQEVVYIGDMLASSVLMSAMTVLIRFDRRIWDGDRPPPSVAGVAASLASTTLFVVALVLALVFTGLTYYSLFILFLTGPLQAIYQRLLQRTWA